MHTKFLEVSLLTVLMCSARLAISAPDSMASAAPPSSTEPEAAAASPPALTPINGVLMLDYQTIQIKGYKPIDLAGFHVYKQVEDWFYVGVGGGAPLAKGNYGGFMVFDVSAYAQKKLAGDLYAHIGASLGGGGGGNSVAQSKVISGGGGYRRGFVGLGYDFGAFSAGVDWSNVRFSGSAIHHSQADFYLQAPFSTHIGAYADSGRSFGSASSGRRPANATKAGDNSLEVGLDNIIQIKPEGSYRKTINLADMQFSHFVTDSSYVLIEGGVGYHGLPIYNQVFGGFGYRVAGSGRLSARAQLAVGSGGYAPEKIDTGSGWLVYPKLSVEYLLNDRLGLSLSGGYLYAPNGTSRNVTAGATLDYHMPATNWGAPGGGDTGGSSTAHRLNIFEQSEFEVKHKDRTQGTLGMLSLQYDNVIDQNLYVPIQASVAYNGYFGYPGYGELSTGLGLQSDYSPHQRLQTFAQVLAGANVKGLIVKPTLGLDYGLSDQLALHAQAGTTLSRSDANGQSGQRFTSSPTVGLGISYRFSLASR